MRMNLLLLSSLSVVVFSLLGCASEATGEDVETSDSALVTAAPLTKGWDGSIKAVASDAKSLFVADDSQGITIVNKATGLSQHVAHPGFDSSIGHYLANVYSYAVAVDDDWAYAVGKNNVIPSNFMVWRVNKVSHATQVVYSGLTDAWSRGPVAVTDSEVIFYLGPPDDAVHRTTWGFYAVPKAGGPLRFLKQYWTGPASLTVVGKNAFAVDSGFLDRIDIATGTTTREYTDGAFNHTFADLTRVGASSLTWIDRDTCRLFSYDLATHKTQLRNAAFVTAHRGTSDCRLAADAGATYWAYTRKETNQNRAFVWALDAAGAGRPVVNTPIVDLPSEPGSTIGSDYARLKVLSLDASSLSMGIENQAQPRGFFRLGRP